MQAVIHEFHLCRDPVIYIFIQRFGSRLITIIAILEILIYIIIIDPDESFDGFDSFTYASVIGVYSDEATVFFSACSSGPDVFFCWKETAWHRKSN